MRALTDVFVLEGSNPSCVTINGTLSERSKESVSRRMIVFLH